MGGLSYFISTLGVVILAISGSVLWIGRRAVDELEAWIPFGDTAFKHPVVGLGLGLALFIAGRSVLDKRSSILRTWPRR